MFTGELESGYCPETGEEGSQGDQEIKELGTSTSQGDQEIREIDTSASHGISRYGRSKHP
jgi:hypothetical protein